MGFRVVQLRLCLVFGVAAIPLGLPGGRKLGGLVILLALGWSD